ncbi:hypothetical protein [Amycolatopsis sp.]|uniref:hypothetical protein n=1 Tax=Amycolatopsis sp. TaxID=37632 RepID=UPI00262342B9|nr:hypothetical protein [Amycolatopsis sp.]
MAVPRHTEAIMASWRAGQFDEDVYNRALIAMGEEGHTGFVLITWARLISCAYVSNEELFRDFRQDESLDPAIASRGV